MKNDLLTALQVAAPDAELAAQLTHKIDYKTKPLGALGQLEALALQMGLVQQTLTPTLTNPQLVVFAADHGVANSGVSAYPQAVTHQMVLNFLAGGAAINVFTKQHGIGLTVVDAGVNHDFGEATGMVHAKAGPGTANFLAGPAMTAQQLAHCLQTAHQLVGQLAGQGCNVIGFGEMGIGNTTSAAALMAGLLQVPATQCVGRGTGLDAAGVARKAAAVQQAIDQHGPFATATEALLAVGGFEIAMLCGAMLSAAQHGMLVLVDGFIATAAYLCAHNLQPNIQHYAVFCHQSHEQGHALLLQHLKARPLLQLDLRLGEGTGCALAYPLLQSAAAFMHEMASFEQAGVSNKEA